ncbi:MAG: glycosyltransferase family 2 protein [Gemmatimonadetes bacterium]|nr:glycosyltransferase family 2 protein [Gemmatimonadota bacterium]
MRPPRPRVSIVAPVYNEEEGLGEFYRRVGAVLHQLAVEHEFVLVNDGSTDGSLELLARLAGGDPRVRVVDLSRNFGHQTAITAGLAHATGDCVVVMDADLQDDPQAIPRMLEEWRTGADVVYAVRTSRQESWPLRIAFRLFYRLYQRLASLDVPLDSGDFSLMDRRVVQELNALPERSRFVRGLRSWIGFRQVGIPVPRAARHAGTPKYTLTKLVRLALDGIFAFSQTPLRLASILGFVISGFAFVAITVVLYWKYVRDSIVSGFATTTIALAVLFLGGIQLLTIGILGEYLGRVYEEVKRRPHFIVRGLIGFPRAASAEKVGETAERTGGVPVNSEPPVPPVPGPISGRPR